MDLSCRDQAGREVAHCLELALGEVAEPVGYGCRTFHGAFTHREPLGPHAIEQGERDREGRARALRLQCPQVALRYAYARFDLLLREALSAPGSQKALSERGPALALIRIVHARKIAYRNTLIMVVIQP